MTGAGKLRVAAHGAWTDREGPPRAHLLAPKRRAEAGTLARIVAHALGKVLGSHGHPPIPVVIASAGGEIGARDPLLALEAAVASMTGVGSVMLVSAGAQTVAAGLWAAVLDEPSVVVWADGTPAAELAVALRLEPPPHLEIATLDWPARGIGEADDLPRRYLNNPCVGALRVYESLQTLVPGSSRRVALDARRGSASFHALVVRSDAHSAAASALCRDDV